MRARFSLLITVVLVLTVVSLTAVSALPGDRRAVVATLYADGSVDCPDHWADDLSSPAGKVVFRTTADGVWFHIVFTDAAPNSEYNVAVNLEDGDCITGTQNFSGFTTNQNGKGVFSGTYITGPETYSIQVNVASIIGVPPNPKHREIAPAGFVEITVP